MKRHIFPNRMSLTEICRIQVGYLRVKLGQRSL